MLHALLSHLSAVKAMSLYGIFTYLFSVTLIPRLICLSLSDANRAATARGSHFTLFLVVGFVLSFIALVLLPASLHTIAEHFHCCPRTQAIRHSYTFCWIIGLDWQVKKHFVLWH